MKSENLFLIWKIISFLYLSQVHFLYRDCPFFFLPYPPSASPSLPSETGRLVSSPIATHTSLRSAISPSIPFHSLFLSLYFPFDITKKEEGSGNGGEPGPEGRKHSWLPLTAATSNSRDHWRRRRKQKKNPRLVPKKIYPPFDFWENSSSFDFRENPCKPQGKQKKLLFFFSLCFLDIF